MGDGVAVVAVAGRRVRRRGSLSSARTSAGKICCEPRERGADGVVEREFEAGQDVGFEPGVVELGLGERDQVAPLVAQA